MNAKSNLALRRVFGATSAGVLVGGVLAIGPLVPAAPVHAAAIVVTTTVQGLGVAGCTLQEAILAANHDTSVVFYPDGIGHSFDTGCVAGSGDDVIVLAAPATYPMSHIVDDAYNHLGPTATPMITSAITIEGAGAVLQRAAGAALMRAFAVGEAGHLDLREVHVSGFAVKGGNGWSGGGGGLGAGGAIYVHGGSLLVQWSTFEGNVATGGNGRGNGTPTTGFGPGGGGGGLSGNGGSTSSGDGGGGGGARGDGGGCGGGEVGCGGGGGGTLTAGEFDRGGYRCGGDPGDGLTFTNGESGHCPGGGGGGGDGHSPLAGEDGGGGAYGGGGGGAAVDSGDGGGGGFGGGGGGGPAENTLVFGEWQVLGGSGGDGGFGGGGGAGPGGLFFGGPGVGGTFAGNATDFGGGGGAGLGGAIFGHQADITISNSTFTRNAAVRGIGGGEGAQNGADAGGAIFTVAGSLMVVNSTIAGNESTGDGAGITVYKPTTGEATAFALRNTIVAGNSGRDECFVLNGAIVSGSDNLITPHADDDRTPCPGIALTDDPQLGSLALNAPGRTPTKALAATSPAIDSANPVLAPLDDQRGVARPQLGGPDIGAYEYFPPPDTTAPTASPAQAPAVNANGWNNSDVTVTWTWADEPGGSGIDAANCTASNTSSGEGAAMQLTATCDDVAGNTGRATHTMNVDTTAPTVTCAAAPAYTIGGDHSTDVTATVTDGLSGPAAASVSADVTAADVATAGVKSTNLTGWDLADNSTTVACTYTVAYNFLGFLEPIPQSNYKRGSRIPVRFQLGDAGGTPIPDADAQALVAACLAQVTLDAAASGCATYDAAANVFQFDLRLPKNLALGDHDVGIRVSAAGGGIVNTDSTTIVVR